MKNPIFSTILWTLVAFGMADAPGVLAAAPSKAAGTTPGPDNGTQMRTLYGQLALAISGGEQYDKTSDSFICIRPLGIPISQGFSELNPNDAFLLSLQFDYIPEINHFYHSSNYKFSDVYKHILTDKQTNMPKEDKARTKDIQDTKLRIQSKISRFNIINQNIVTAKNALSLAKGLQKTADQDLLALNQQATNPPGLSPLDALTYKAQLKTMRDGQAADSAAAQAAYNQAKFNFDKANDDYRSFGGDAVKADIDHLTTLNNASGLAWWKDLRDTFDAANVSTGRDQYEVLFFPEPHEWNPVGGDQGTQDVWPATAYVGLPDAVGKPPQSAPAAAPATPAAPADGSGTATPTDASGAATPTDSSGAAAPADGSGAAAPADGSGAAAPADGSGAAAPADGSGSAAPADGSGSAAPGDGSASSGPADCSATVGPIDLALAQDQPAAPSGTATPTTPGLSWTHFRFTAIDESNLTSSTSSTNSVSGGYSNLFASASGGHSDEKHVQLAANHDHSFQISVDLASVSVFRPWLDMTVFLSNSWWFGDPYKNDVISYGHDFSKHGAMMPLYYSQIILARNLVMNATDLDSYDQAIQQAAEDHASVSYMGFNMSGAHSSQSSDTSHSKKGHVTQISVKGVQVIGYVCNIVPPCPTGKQR